MDSANYLIAALHDRPDRIASALWGWMQRYNATVEELADFLECDGPALERLAWVSRPRPGADWEGDIEIIAISLKIAHKALYRLLTGSEEPQAREYGA